MAENGAKLCFQRALDSTQFDRAIRPNRDHFTTQEIVGAAVEDTPLMKLQPARSQLRFDLNAIP